MAVPPPASSSPPRPRREAPSGNARKNFIVVARALGEDPEQLISEFCEGWLDELRGKRRKVDERKPLDDYLSPLER